MFLFVFMLMSLVNKFFFFFFFHLNHRWCHGGEGVNKSF